MYVNPTVSNQMPLTCKHHDSAASITTVNGHHSQAGLFLTQNLLFVVSLSQQGNTNLLMETKLHFPEEIIFFKLYDGDRSTQYNFTKRKFFLPLDSPLRVLIKTNQLSQLFLLFKMY